MLSFKFYPDDPPAFRVVIFAPKSGCLEATHLVYVAWKTVTHSRRCGFNIARTISRGCGTPCHSNIHRFLADQDRVSGERASPPHALS